MNKHQRAVRRMIGQRIFEIQNQINNLKSSDPSDPRITELEKRLEFLKNPSPSFC